MKLKKTHLFLSVAIFFVSACGTKPPADPGQAQPPPPSKVSEGIRARVTFGGLPLPGVTVKYSAINGAEQITQLTDQDGYCTFQAPHVPDQEGNFNLTYQNKLSKNYILPIRKPYVEIAVDADMVRQEQRRLQSIDQDLNSAEKILNKIQKDLEAYLKKNPGSAMDEFKQVLQKKYRRLDQLKDRVKNLTQIYGGLLDNIDELDLIDFKQHERNLFNFRMEEEEFRKEVTEAAQFYEDNENAQPDENWLQTDIFFASGQWKLSKLTAIQRNKLTEGLDRIKNLQKSSYPDYRVDELFLKIVFIGYTDGAPVFEKDKLDLRPRCRQDGVGDSADGNICLSYLRARSIRDYFQQNLPAYHTKDSCDGKGSILAPDQLDRAEYRKCVVSFIMLPLEEIE